MNIIKSHVNLDIEEGGYYPRFHSQKNIQVAKLSIRKFIEKNTKEKYDTNYFVSQSQLNLIFQSCKSEFIKIILIFIIIKQISITEMSLFKNREEHENYINSILSSQKDTMDDKLLHVFLWEKVKLIFKYDDSVNELYVDNDDNVIFLEDENGIMIIGYLQIDKRWDTKSKHDSGIIVNALVDFINDISKLAKEKKISSYSFIMISTFRLSGFENGVFSRMPKDISYFYLAEIDENKKLYFDLNRDEKIIERIDSDVWVDGFFEYTSKMHKKPHGIWHCDICDGNDNIGCQYFDPTECPKFS